MRILPKTKHSYSILICLFLLALLTSCVQDAGTKRKKSTLEEKATIDTTTPTIPSKLNFFQNNSIQYNTLLPVPADFQGQIYFRGNEVHEYAQNNNSSVQCLVSIFPNSTTNKILISAATPRFFNNFATNTKEYYYLINFSDKTSTQNFCQTVDLISAMGTAYPTYSIAYSLAEVCPTCSASQLVTSSVELYSGGGSNISNISSSYLKVQITAANNSSDPNLVTCSTSTTCIAKGYDCCSLGQCVSDKQLKNGVDQTDADYLQSVQDILSTPSKIYDYPQFYHLCSSNVTPDPTPTSFSDAIDQAARRLEELQELYDCTSPTNSEVGLCTVTTDSPTTGNTYETLADDQNFSSIYSGTIGIPSHSLNRIIHSGETIFENNTYSASDLTIGVGNNNLTDKQSITLLNVASPTAKRDELKIRYHIDGSCEKVNSSLARCYKIYEQGQNKGLTTDHFPASNDFLVPVYANTTMSIKVEVDDAPYLEGSHWSLLASSPAVVTFLGTGLQVADTQTVKITFFVDTNVNNVLQLKQTSLERIQEICECANTVCRLEPKIENSVVVDYNCIYPQPPRPDPPLVQNVLLNSKSVAQLFFDTTGVYQSSPDLTMTQEGNEFTYTKGDLLKPNNVATDIGFNEIYGSFNHDTTAPVPATKVDVKAGKSYIVYVNSGSFSTCYYCGNDFYSGLAKIFPQSFLYQGGGYSPAPAQTDRFSSETYRADDLLFGRACFVPATMIPWTHRANSDRQQQRLLRQNGQHFLFANGYQRDWYGFDYGSVIGSFDGVRWFSIGNSRRIKATTNRLFLAINAYFGDQTITNTFNLTVVDASTVLDADNEINNNFESRGAECQKYHVCETDQDCAGQLGWDYVCETVSNMSTNWPKFDANGQERPNQEETLNILQLFETAQGGPKRCVYRGRGAACHTNYNVTDENNAYSGTTKPGLHACSSNNYCQSFVSGVPVAKFNNRISRYGKSPTVQNANSIPVSDADTFGLGARNLGRPYDWNGLEEININASANLSHNKISALCIPGRSPSSTNILTAHSNTPGNDYGGDQVIGMGMTLTGTGSSEYLSSCSIFDSSGDYWVLDSSNFTKNLNDNELVRLAGQQAISTNSLALLETLSGIELTKDFDSEQVTDIIHQKNRCLRAPGSTCFSNFECAPSNWVASRVSNIDSDSSTVQTTLNKYEVQFWQEGLICSQEDAPTASDFSLGNNRCCRETGKTITIGSLADQTGFAAPDTTLPNFDNQNIPGLGALSLSSSSRYSRLSTIYDLMSNATEYPPIEGAGKDFCTQNGTCKTTNDLDKQYNSIAAMAERTCCSANWVRNFSKNGNGGGHEWGPGKMQNIPKESFKCLNWLQCSGATCGTNFTCNHTEQPDDPDCLARTVTNSEANTIFDWVSNLEMLGIPQVRVKSDDFADILCRVDPNDQSLAGTTAPPNLISNIAADGEFTDGSGNYFSGDDMTNFDSGLKEVFSPDEFSCCLPPGTTVADGTDASSCCTGFINSQTKKCQFKDFSNLSVYFNRYISSGAKDLSSGEIDPKSGFIKNFDTVIRLACQINACASGKVVLGVSHSDLKVPGTKHQGSSYRHKRFIDDNSDASNFSGLADLYDDGLRWNNNVYCAPVDSNLPNTFDCSSF